MKNLLLILFMVAGSSTGRLLAQDHGMANKEKMKVFAGWLGHWKGEGSMQQGPGDARKTSVDEHIETRLGGTILVIEGVGTTKDPATKQDVIVHHAYAVLSFDQVSGDYKFRSYLHDGRSTDAWLKVLDQNKYQWGFDSPHGKVRYSINMDGQKKTWNEVGEYSQEGTRWTKFFEMNLVKVE